MDVLFYRCPIAILRDASPEATEYLSYVLLSYDYRLNKDFDFMPARDVEAYKILKDQVGYLETWYMKEGYKDDNR